ncbi:MAG TPA: ABC transporter permease, partial [Vicinamibacterales bacterium]|nr:ABC transporter permease [Vicinamibacterales bacterium]
MRASTRIDELWFDVRYALRTFTRQKAFTAAVVATLALGIGATTAVFSVISGVVLRPLPLPEPERLIELYETSALSNGEPEAVAWKDVDDIRRQSASLASIAGYATTARFFRGIGEPERTLAVTSEHDFFTMLGVTPVIGRTFTSDDPNGVAVVSEAFWTSRLGGDRSILGKPISLDGEPYTVIGVMPESFQFPYGAASILGSVASEARTDL